MIDPVWTVKLEPISWGRWKATVWPAPDVEQGVEVTAYTRLLAERKARQWAGAWFLSELGGVVESEPGRDLWFPITVVAAFVVLLALVVVLIAVL